VTSLPLQCYYSETLSAHAADARSVCGILWILVLTVIPSSILQLHDFCAGFEITGAVGEGPTILAPPAHRIFSPSAIRGSWQSLLLVVNLLNIWQFVYFICGLSPPKRRVVRRHNLARRRVPIMNRTCAGFLPARRYASAGYRDRNVSVRLSVRPSRAGIVSKRRKLASW